MRPDPTDERGPPHHTRNLSEHTLGRNQQATWNFKCDSSAVHLIECHSHHHLHHPHLRKHRWCVSYFINLEMPTGDDTEKSSTRKQPIQRSLWSFHYHSPGSAIWSASSCGYYPVYIFIAAKRGETLPPWSTATSATRRGMCRNFTGRRLLL